MILFELLALLLATNSARLEHPIKRGQDVIKISNVCININYGYEYTIVSNIDYFRINVAYNGVNGYIYVGHNPEILDENRKWQSRSLRAKMAASRVVVLEGSQAGQVLGVPLGENDQYFHLWFKDASGKQTDPIKKIVNFCK